jgi:glutamate 5-kinase
VEARKNDASAQPRDVLRTARRIVVKVGTNTVSDETGTLSVGRVEPIAASIARLIRSGRQVVLVSSGAVGLGRGWLGLHRSRLDDLATKQACAAVGQSLLMEAYKTLFQSKEIKVAQVLLTEDDFTNWTRYSNLRQTMEKLLGFGVLPIVNENDTVSTAELESVTEGSRAPAFSDNDRLAGLVMSGLEADALVLLTNVDGLLRQEPAGRGRSSEDETGDNELISTIEAITPELRSLASGPARNGRGGMRTKVEAAEIAMNCGGTAVIANGGVAGVLDRIFAGDEVGTVFLPAERMAGKRRWLAYAAGVRGRVVVDAGAQSALTRKKASLLASGIVRVESPFAAQDVVSVVNTEGQEFARGIANCASDEAERHKVGKSHAKAVAEDAKTSLVLITRDNIVLLEKS